MTPAAIAAVVEEFRAYESGERDGPMTWKVLTQFSGFSHVSLWKKPAIKAAFSTAQQAKRADATPTMSAPKTADERLVALQAVVDELRKTIRDYDEQWALYEHNVHRLGVDPDELRKPLDSVPRASIKSRRMRVVR